MADFMTIQHLVDPGNIERELLKLWDALAKEKMRACLFNLIVFNQLSARTDYIRHIVQKVSEKYPCRVLFISSDPDSSDPYLKTAVSVVGDAAIACEYIDIGVAGSEMEKVPFVLLPHIIPDLPVSLLWTEDPTRSHPLFASLSKLASRVIFDSESADSLLLFSQTVLSLKEQTRVDTADLNWARTEEWRDLITSLFDSQEKLDLIKGVKIVYNARETESFYHLKVQSMYLLAWLARRLRWRFEKASPNLEFTFQKQHGEISASEWKELGSGTLISVDFITFDGWTYRCARNREHCHQVEIQVSSAERCELPSHFMFGQTATGQSLIKEIIRKGTSAHYLEMLQELQNLDRNEIC